MPIASRSSLNTGRIAPLWMDFGLMVRLVCGEMELMGGKCSVRQQVFRGLDRRLQALFALEWNEHLPTVPVPQAGFRRIASLVTICAGRSIKSVSTAVRREGDPLLCRLSDRLHPVFGSHLLATHNSQRQLSARIRIHQTPYVHAARRFEMCSKTNQSCLPQVADHDEAD